MSKYLNQVISPQISPLIKHKATKSFQSWICCCTSPCSYLRFQGTFGSANNFCTLSLQPKVGLIKPASMLMYGSSLMAVTLQSQGWKFQLGTLLWAQHAAFHKRKPRARKPCPRKRAPMEDVATPWPNDPNAWKSANCGKIQPINLPCTHRISSTSKALSGIAVACFGSCAFPKELHTPPETTMYLTPCMKRCVKHCLKCELLCDTVNYCDTMKENNEKSCVILCLQMFTVRRSCLLNLGSECGACWRRWWHQVLGHFIKIILSGALKKIWQSKT